jgi:aminoglycoside phosphotransferase (APT) family kinase protein
MGDVKDSLEGRPVTAQEQTFAQRAAKYLASALGVAEVRVSAASLIVGGASRETRSVDAQWEEADGAIREQGLIFRLDPPSSLLRSNRRTEFEMYQVMYDVPGVPVPKPLFIEDDPSHLGLPFFVMERLDGVASPTGLLAPEFNGRREQIVRQAWRALGSIAKADCREIGLDRILEAPAPADAWAVELRRWERILDEHDLGPMPVTRAVIRELRRIPPPPPPKVAVVHGDFRVGNYLFSRQGCVAILDWEMAHLGDPHEDIAWALLRNWRHAVAPEKVGACLAPRDAIAIWESTSGMKVNPDALRWWKLFSHVKGNGIWMTAAHEFAAGESRALMYGTMEWALVGTQEMWMLEDLGVVKP